MTAEVNRPLARAGVELLISALLALTVSAFAISESSLHGRLALPAGYDDVGYFIDAQRWLNHLSTNGIVWGAFDLLRQHSPFSTAAAALGFAVLGPYDWAPYCVNGLFLSAVFWAVLRLLAAEGVPLLAAIAIVSILPLSPFFPHAVSEFRPDLFNGIATAFCILLLFRKPAFRSTPRRQFALGLLFGTALIIKPSAFLGIGFIIAVAVIASTAAFLADQKLSLRDQIRPIARCYLYLLLGTGAIFGPYLIVSGSDILAYTYASLVTQSAFWSYRGDLFDQALFYWYEIGGIALYFWFPLGIAVFALRVLTAILAKERLAALVASYALLFVIYATISATTVKYYFFGAVLYATFILLVARDLGWLLGWMRKRYSLFGISPGDVALVSALAFCLFFVPHSVLLYVYEPDYVNQVLSATRESWVLVQERVQAASERGEKAPFTALVNGPDPVRSAAIELEFERKKLNARISYGFSIASAEEFLTMAKKADLIIVTSSTPDTLPGPRLGDLFQDSLRGSSDFRSVEVLNGKLVRSIEVFEPTQRSH